MQVYQDAENNTEIKKNDKLLKVENRNKNLYITHGLQHAEQVLWHFILYSIPVLLFETVIFIKWLNHLSKKQYFIFLFKKYIKRGRLK